MTTLFPDSLCLPVTAVKQQQAAADTVTADTDRTADSPQIHLGMATELC